MKPIHKENLIQSAAHFIKDLIQLLNDFYPKWIPTTDQAAKNLANDIIITCLKNMGSSLRNCQPIRDVIFSHYKTYLEKRVRTFNPNTETTQSNYAYLLNLVLKIYKALFSLAIHQNEGYDQILLILPYIKDKTQSNMSLLTQAFLINFCLNSKALLNFYKYIVSKKVIYTYS